ncbi:ABC transporter permease [Candidatus Synechococcus spongiarum]|uniref:ABC transporter permease n=1 Tax=Candidatus Synechococcus spongiarum TaxID=431041 RepID=UPI0004713F02|nr:iron ABC transporter permease [Candidatus Synechococcus spongiarum]
MVQRRPSLIVLVLAIAGLALAPVIMVAWLALQDQGIAEGIGVGVINTRQLRGTIGLLATVGLGVTLLGVTTGWVTACCRFPGRRFLRSIQLLPLATPAYLLAATLVDLGSIQGWRVYGFVWGVVVLSLANYPYVFLLTTDSFSRLGQRQLEACRTLSLGPWGSFWRVALPLTLPAVGAGIALSGMEVVNELGAVELLGVPTLSYGILQRWQEQGNPTSAAQMALVTLVVVASLVALERWLRRRSRRWALDGRSVHPSLVWPLAGWRAATAQVICALPPALSLGVPLLWMSRRWQGMAEDPQELLTLTGNTVILASAAAVLTIAVALFLAVARRWIRHPLLQRLVFVASMGYAIPGTVLALGLLALGGRFGWTPLTLLVLGYTDRFMAVGRGGFDAALERIPPTMEEAATSLGSNWQQTLWRIHLPLLAGPLRVGALLVFVDTIKELPLTFALRPFNFDTLSVRVFQYAGDERLNSALGPAALILTLGLVASFAMMRTTETLASQAAPVAEWEGQGKMSAVKLKAP